MTTLVNLTSDEIERFEAFAKVTSATYDANDNLTNIVLLWGNIQKTIALTYSSSNLATTTVTWEKV